MALRPQVSLTLSTLAVIVAMASPTAAAAANPALEQTVLDIMRLERGSLQTIAPEMADGGLTARLEIDGVAVWLELKPHSVRAPGYKVYTSGADGVLVEVEPGPVNTWRGSLRDRPESRVSAFIMPDGLHASIDFGDGLDRYWVEPIARRVPDAAPGLFVVYSDSDVIPNLGSCGVNDKVEGIAFPPPPGGVDGADCSEVATAELACDADFSYFQDWGGNTEGRINGVINQVNGQYEDDVDITHEITTVIIRMSPVYSSNDAFTLLSQFRSRWLSSHGDVQRDVAHLFTGRNLNGGTIGIAWGIGEICTSGAYCLSQSDCCGGFGCATDLTAHELGHLWGASHCSCQSPNFTMNPFILCANRFSSSSIGSISAHRDSRSCLEGGPAAYCSAESITPNEGHIAQVQIGEIDNFSGASGYSSFACIETPLEFGTPHVLTVTLANANEDFIGGAWIDWNGDLEFDPSEEVTTEWAGVGPYSAIVDVPGDALHSPARLRVRIREGGAVVPCGISSNGEVEDYTILVVDLISGPSNDFCDDAMVVEPGSHEFSSLGASTDGPDEPLQCSFDGDSQIGSDVWFRYQAACTALVTVSTCESDFDTKLAAYEECPGVSFPAIACNDDACGTGSSIFFAALEGNSYVIRLGGFESAQGTGTLVVQEDCLEPPSCPADLDGDAGVGFGDLLMLLSAWGPCPAECPEDLDNDAEVGFGDLLILLSEWGPCP